MQASSEEIIACAKWVFELITTSKQKKSKRQEAVSPEYILNHLCIKISQLHSEIIFTKKAHQFLCKLSAPYLPEVRNYLQRGLMATRASFLSDSNHFLSDEGLKQFFSEYLISHLSGCDIKLEFIKLMKLPNVISMIKDQGKLNRALRKLLRTYPPTFVIVMLLREGANPYACCPHSSRSAIDIALEMKQPKMVEILKKLFQQKAIADQEDSLLLNRR